MTDEAGLVPVGRVGRPHGLDGAFVVERASDDDYVNRKYREVRRSLQTGMDALARRRAFPLFG